MEPYQALTENVSNGPRGKSTGAFFDLDGTIIATHSVVDVFLERLSSGDIHTDEMIDMASMLVSYVLNPANFANDLRSSVKNLRGVGENKLIELAEKVNTERLSSQVFPEVREIIKTHRAKGHTVAIVTSATRYQAAPVARDLGIENVICTELELRQGQFTGKLKGEPCYGRAKLAAARKFARKHRVTMKKSYFYSNGSEDLPLLEAVGHPVAISPDRALNKVAHDRGWPNHKLQSRGWVGPFDLLRTIATFGTVWPSYLAGLPFRLLGASATDAINFSVSSWASAAVILARLKLIIEGEQHLWSHRPAVFIFNHQSAIDMLIAAKLLREDVVGVAKKELRTHLLVGPVLGMAGTIFVDRFHNKDPVAEMLPARDAIIAGKSVVIAPEGTRSPDGKLGEFKTGAFHLSCQTGVPLVPIIIHNSRDALPKHSTIVRPAEVKVTVLEPILTENWTSQSVPTHIERIRRAYLEGLGQADSPEIGCAA